MALLIFSIICSYFVEKIKSRIGGSWEDRGMMGSEAYWDGFFLKPGNFPQMRVCQVNSIHPWVGGRKSSCSRRNWNPKSHEVPKVVFPLQPFKHYEWESTSSGPWVQTASVCLGCIHQPSSKSWSSLQHWSCELLHVLSVISPGKYTKGKPNIAADLVFDAREFIIDMTAIMNSDHQAGKAWAGCVIVHFGFSS